MTNTLAEDYRQDGIVHVPGLLTSLEVETIKASYMDQVAVDLTLAVDDEIPDGDPLARYPRFVHPHRRDDVEAGRIALDLMLDSRILDIVTTLIGPALGAQSMFYFKPPGARGQAMHQDNLFLRSHPETCVAAWIAIDDADAENGGLAVVPGSHRTELVCPEPADLTESFTSVEVPVPGGLQPVQTQLRAGDALFFHGSVVHGSRPNSSSDRFRRALIFHYIPEASTEIATFYDPLVRPDRRTVTLSAATGGGPCGDFATAEP